MKDFLDNDINVGDTIVYPGRQGSSLWMNKGKVVGIDVHRYRYGAGLEQASVLMVRKESGRVYPVYCTDRVVVLPEFIAIDLDLDMAHPDWRNPKLSFMGKVKARFKKIWNWTPMDKFQVQDY